MGNYHVPFWRAVEEVTPSLTLIIDLQHLAVGEKFPNSALYSASVLSQPED